MNTVDLTKFGNCKMHGYHSGKTCPVCGGVEPWRKETLSLTIEGQIMGGKNNMIVTRSGMHFPKKSWATWRDQAVKQVKAQLPRGFAPFDCRMDVRLDYVASDKRRRDMPAIIDAIWHVLEKAGVVTDDTLLWVNGSTRGYEKNEGKAELLLTPAKEVA